METQSKENRHYYNIDGAELSLVGVNSDTASEEQVELARQGLRPPMKVTFTLIPAKKKRKRSERIPHLKRGGYIGSFSKEFKT